MRLRLAPAALAVLFLAACSSTPPAASPSASPSDSPSVTASASASASPSASATPTNTALDCPAWTDDPDAQVSAIGPNRYAGACLGMTFDEATANGTTVVGEEQCPWYATIVGDDDLGFYINAVQGGQEADGTITFFMVKWFGNPADAASYEMPRTPEGITIGSTRAEVLDAYPTASEIEFEDIARGMREQLVVTTGDTTTYNFDIVDKTVTEISWGEGLANGGPNGDLCAL